MSRSSSSDSPDGSAARAQTSPVAGLVVAVAVVAAVGSYAVALDDAGATRDEDRGDDDRRRAVATLDRAHEAVTSGGVAVPARLPDATADAPSEYHLHVTLSAAGRSWHIGPTPPESGDTATTTAEREVGVAVGPGRIRPGRLRVEVWR